MLHPAMLDMPAETPSLDQTKWAI